MARTRVLAAVTAVAALFSAGLLSGCGSVTQAERVSATGCSRHRPGAAAGQSVPRTPWPEHRAGPAGLALAQSEQAVDPVARTAYALVSRTLAPVRGPYVLECIDLVTGLVIRGPQFRAPNLSLASGYLWVYGRVGPGAKAGLSQIDPRSLRVTRSISLPGTIPPAYQTLHVTTGPEHSVWVGSVRVGRTPELLRLDTGSGRILTTIRLPAPWEASDLSADPAIQHLYVSATRTVSGGGVEGNVVLEYDARSGRFQAEADHGLVTYSVAGSALTAVPGGVWVSFRTGMLGLTLHLRQSDLALTAPTGPGVVQSPANGLFHWAMYAVTSYSAGALWLANQAGILACLDPRTGKVRAIERLPQDRLIFRLLAADPAGHRVYAADSRGLVVITPPPACWRG